MYVLIGTMEEVSQKFIGGDFESHFEDTKLATFDDLSSGEAYIKRSRLKQRVWASFGGTKVFRKDSLLGYYVEARIEKVLPDPILPHNP